MTNRPPAQFRRTPDDPPWSRMAALAIVLWVRDARVVCARWRVPSARHRLLRPAYQGVPSLPEDLERPHRHAVHLTQ